jgi:hypothetical protein
MIGRREVEEVFGKGRTAVCGDKSPSGKTGSFTGPLVFANDLDSCFPIK